MPKFRSNLDGYDYFKTHALVWMEHREQRIEALRQMYTRQHKDKTSIGMLVDSDSGVREAQILMERNIATATMFGIGAIIDELRRR